MEEQGLWRHIYTIRFITTGETQSAFAEIVLLRTRAVEGKRS